MPLISLDLLNISALPSAEDDAFEYKSSATPFVTLQNKIVRAMSAFGNSGGGCFVAGVADDGTPDGGLEQLVGKQSLRDWTDQAIMRVSPPIAYEVRFFDKTTSAAKIDTDKVVMAISVAPSDAAPHMADDKKYYIRAGAHTVPASHFIVEALWARRSFSKPMLTHTVREKPGNPDVIQVGLVALTPAPALDVELQITPLLGMLKSLERFFPIRLPVVDRSNPFFLDATLHYNFHEEFPDNVVLACKYRDIAGNQFVYKSSRPLKEAVSPIQLGPDHLERIAAVAAAYGWPADLAEEEILARLPALNLERAEG